MEFELLWKARITTHDGENEYSDDIFIRGAKNEEEALKEARYQAQHWYGDEAKPNTDFGDKDYWDEAGGYRIIELEGVRKIETWEELLQALYVVDFKDKH
jgi:hypothetical protein